MTFPLSKVMDVQADLPQLAEELAVVDAVGIGSQASEYRRWEYAIALRAIRQHGRSVREHVDVGGAGSLFWKMVHADRPLGAEPRNTLVVDPDAEEQLTLAEHVQSNPVLADVVTCLSVLEHIPVRETEQFCYHLGALVAPGGLLVLTVDFAEDGTTDPHHFHWMREQIFDRDKMLRLMAYTFAPLGFGWLGPYSYEWPGPAVYPNYTFASLVLTRRP